MSCQKSSSEEGCLKLNGNTHWLRKLGVWNKDYWFKVIDTPDIEFVADCENFVTNDYLVVYGINLSNVITQESKVIIIPIKHGYWGERKQPEPIKEKSWWDKVKPCWW